MNKYIKTLFSSSEVISDIQNKLPYLFQLAEIDNSRDGKLGMEIGSARERILIALLMYRFGEENVSTNTPINETEVDAFVFNKPLSIKTTTGKNISGIKLIWTVDAQKALEFSKTYKPGCDMILAKICWNEIGALYYIPVEVQEEVLEKLGRNLYIKLPKPGTNPRGVEMSSLAIKELCSHRETLRVDIKWNRKETMYNSYERWIDYWASDIMNNEII